MIKNKNCYWDHNKLKGRIIEICGTLQNFADKLGINIATLCKKLNNVTYFSTSEVYLACEILKISENEILDYFFKKEVR